VAKDKWLDRESFPCISPATLRPRVGRRAPSGAEIDCLKSWSRIPASGRSCTLHFTLQISLPTMPPASCSVSSWVNKKRGLRLALPAAILASGRLRYHVLFNNDGRVDDPARASRFPSAAT